MPLEDWAAVAEIVGAVAVVITLIYLSIQVKHNTRAIQGQTISDVTRNVHEHANMVLQGQDVATALKKFASDKTLDPDDAILIDFLLTAVFVARQNEYFQWKQGLLDESIFRSLHHVIYTLLESPNGQFWWQHEGRRMLAPDFVDFVEKIVADSSSDSLASWREAIRLSDSASETS
jgi:hypothetical protein